MLVVVWLCVTNDRHCTAAKPTQTHQSRVTHKSRILDGESSRDIMRILTEKTKSARHDQGNGIRRLVAFTHILGQMRSVLMSK